MNLPIILMGDYIRTVATLSSLHSYVKIAEKSHSYKLIEKKKNI